MDRLKMKWERYDKILSLLETMKVATRDQLQHICNLGGDRNALRVLGDMESQKLLESVRGEKKVYWIGRKGAERLGIKYVKRGLDMHGVMRNDLWINMGCPDWQVEQEVIIRGKTLLVCDATYQEDNERFFIEVDRTQSMKENEKKIERYQELFKMSPGKLVFYTLPNRVHKLGKMVGNLGTVISEEVFH